MGKSNSRLFGIFTSKKTSKRQLLFLSVPLVCTFAAIPNLHPDSSAIAGSVRVQMPSSTVVRLEVEGVEGFEVHNTFHVISPNRPSAAFTSNIISGEVALTTTNHSIHIPQRATSLSGVYAISLPPSGTLGQSLVNVCGHNRQNNGD
jgi:hypothetical protein